MDEVKSPSWYVSDGMECKEAALAFLGKEGYIAGCQFNINKYNWRAGKKESLAKDMRKIIEYAQMILEVLEDDVR